MSTFTWFLIASVAFGALSAVVNTMLPAYVPTPSEAPTTKEHAAPTPAAAPVEDVTDPGEEPTLDSPLDEVASAEAEAAPKRPPAESYSEDDEDDDDGPTQLIKPEQFGDLLDD